MSAEEYVQDEEDVAAVSGFGDDIQGVLFEYLVGITQKSAQLFGR